jgi:hypothetical protein
MEFLRVLVAEFIPIAVLSGFIFYARWRRKKRRERPPIEDKLLRTPGYSLSGKIEDLNDTVQTLLVATVTSSLCFAFILTRPNPQNASADYLPLAVLALIPAICIVIILRKANKLRMFRFGLLGEQFMAEQLQTLAGYRVFHDIPGGGKWNVDHVAVGPAGVFAIETKCRSKKPSRNNLREQDAVFDGKIIHFPWFEDRKVVDQARANARWLGGMLTKATGERVTTQPIIALPGWLVTLKTNSDLKVLSGKQVPGYIASLPATLSPKAIQQISYQLEQRCRDVMF